MSRRVVELIAAPDGALAMTKITYLVFACTFTFHMLRHAPADPWLWLIYAGTAGGVDVAKKALNMRYAQGARQ